MALRRMLPPPARPRAPSAILVVTLPVLLAVVLAFPRVGAAQPVAVDLGTLGGTFSEAFAVNATGQVVGRSTIAGDVAMHAFSWTQAGGMVDLGTLGGAESLAAAVNAQGQVVGYSYLSGGEHYHAFSWTQGGGMVDLGTLGGSSSYAVAVNDAGQVLGTSDFAGDYAAHAFLWTEAGGMVDLGTLGGSYSTAVGLNDNGQVVGQSLFADDASAHAFSWTEAGGMVDLGTLGGTYSVALSVNAHGQVVGYSYLAGDAEYHAFLWTQADGMVDLGTSGAPDSSAFAINAHGQVVGISTLEGTTDFHAFSWTQAGGMVDLGTLGGRASSPWAVNAHGRVVGESLLAGNAALHAFVWTQAGGMVDLGTLGGTSSQAFALNDDCQVVGNSTLAGELPSFGEELARRGVRVDVTRHAALWNLGVGSCVTVEAISVSPSAGTGSTQAFTLEYRDSRGAADLQSARVRFAASNVAPGTCTAKYTATTEVIELLNDAGTAWTSGTLGSGILSNSQCTLNLASSTATLSGNNLTVVLNITFSQSFTGLQNVYMLAASAGGVNTGWVPRGTWTPNPPAVVEAISVTPSAGSGATQPFTLEYSDSLGASDLTSARVRFGASNVGPATCTAWYNAVAATIALLDDAGTTWATGTLGSGTLSNSQCTLDLASSAATPSGTNLTVVLDITFNASFSGLKQIYMLAASSRGPNTGWQPRGTWTPHPEPGPAVVEAISVTPNSGSGGTQAFTLQYSDTHGATDLSSARVRFGAGNAGPGTCTAWYNAVAGTIALLNDAGTAWTSGTLGSGTLANGQCTLNLAGSSATPSGNHLTVVLQITFASSFRGMKQIYMLAQSASGPNTGWLPKGTWTPYPDLGPAVVEAISVTPNAGSGATQAFTLQYSDTHGAADLQSARVRFAPGNVGPGTCTAWYNAVAGTIGLLNDAGTVWATGTLGSGTLANSQCTLNLASSAATPSGNQLTVVLDITFASTFTGLKNIYMLAASATGVNTGWQLRGTWTPNQVPGPPVVSAISVTPNATPTPVATQTFTMQYSDTAGATADLTSARVRFSTSAAIGAWTCTAWYNAVTNVIQLLNDAGSGWQTGTPGIGTLENAQCTVDLAESSATPSGATLTLVLAIAFKPAFTGPQNIYMLAASATGVNTGWQLRGSWMAYPDPGPAVVDAISISPNSGSGATQTFTLLYSDSHGAADLQSARVRFGASNVGPGTCTIWYNAVTNTVQILNDAATSWQVGAFGAGTLSNSQCTLNLATSAANPNGTTLTLTLALAFSAGFRAPKSIYMLAASASGTSTGWLQRGSWDEPVFVVSGTVRDAGNLNLLSNASVQLAAGTASSLVETAFEGEFSFAGVRGAATLTVAAAGYDTRSMTIDVLADTSVDVPLPRVAGRVVPCGDAPDTGNRVLPVFSRPFEGTFPLTNYFDHDLPGAAGNGYQWNYCDEQVTGRIDGHSGYDWLLPEGTPVLAVAGGRTTFLGTDAPFYCDVLGRVVSDQLFVEVTHPPLNGEQFSSVVVHLSRIDVSVGQEVERGQAIGLSGNTGCSTEPHLHFHVWRFTHTNNGRPTRVDPYGWEGAGVDPWSQHPSGSGSIWLWQPGEAPALHPR